MSVYSELLNHAQEGGKYKIDLKNKSLKIGNKNYIKNGEVLIEDELFDSDLLMKLQDPWNKASELYNRYKHSIPTSHYKDNSYFKALKYEELSSEELAYGLYRNYAQAALEGFILLASIKGLLKWQNDKHWFWQDENNKDFIILKEYV